MERIIRTDGDGLDALLTYGDAQNPILLQQQLWSAEKSGLSGGASSIFPLQAVLQSYTNAGNIDGTPSQQLLYSSRDFSRQQLSTQHYAITVCPTGANKQIHLSNKRSNPTNTTQLPVLPCATEAFKHKNAATFQIADQFDEFRHSCKFMEDSISSKEANTSTLVKGSTPEVAAKPSVLHTTSVAKYGSSRLGSGNTSKGSCRPQISGKSRRKMQEKRIVCVPLSKGTGRPNGEGHSSDMWAWRKYGQKPIKGSPYPRGYYRCSSCKGCSARKQVEISRNDPSMLIITYTSDHNHQAPMATTHTHSNPSPLAASKQLHTTTEENLNISELEEVAEAFQKQFCSINSSSTMLIDPVTIDTAIIKREPSADMKMMCSIPNANYWSTSQDMEEFFAELEELPESSTIFEGPFINKKSSDDEAIDVSTVVTSDPCKDHLMWSSSNSNLNSMVNT